MDQGERLTFRNTDVAGHDVTARDPGPDNKPLFATPIIGAGESAFVEGSQYLTPGAYPFLCSIHPQMTGTLTVTGAGTPVPRPAPGTPAVADTTRPVTSARVSSRRLRVVRRARAIVATVKVDEAATVTLRAVSRPRVGGPLVTVARGRVKLTAAGSRRVTMTPHRRRPARRSRPQAPRGPAHRAGRRPRGQRAVGDDGAHARGLKRSEFGSLCDPRPDRWLIIEMCVQLA